MPREVLIVSSSGYAYIDDAFEWEVHVAFERYARQVDYLADTLDSDEPERQVGDRLRRQRIMRVVIPAPADKTDLDAILALTVAGFRQAAEWADGGRIAFSLDHGGPGMIALAPLGMLQMHTSELELLVHALEAGIDVSSAPRWQAVVDLGRTLVDEDGRPRVQRVDVMSCSVAVGPTGERAIDALARIWRVPVRGLIGDFVITETRETGCLGAVQPMSLSFEWGASMYGLVYQDRWPDDPRLFYAAQPP